LSGAIQEYHHLPHRGVPLGPWANAICHLVTKTANPIWGNIWTQADKIRDHADGVMIGNLSGDPKAEPRMYTSASDEGFIMFDLRGNILKQIRVGHNQSPSVGKYRPDLRGLQYMAVNFWKNLGIVTLFDWNILAQDEPIHTGSPMLPVNWRGDGQEFVLLSANMKEGRMIDGGPPPRSHVPGGWPS